MNCVDSVSMKIFFSIFFIGFWFDQVESGCCRLPFSDGLCRVNLRGPHRYQLMPDRKSGNVNESTECFINDFDASYRKVSHDADSCNDCPGLLILHVNSSEILLFPEYLERILEGRPEVQRKNLVILTSNLTGAYDLDFTLLSRYYQSYPVSRIPSVFIDLELPAYDPRKEAQPILRLRLPNDPDSEDATFRINREELINAFDVNGQPSPGLHALPYIYHFDSEKHIKQRQRCVIYQIGLTPSTLEWKRLDSEGSACHTFMPFFGRNPCFSTGFSRLFCPIHENIENTDRLVLSPYVQQNNRVEHLTLAVTGGPQVSMSLSNEQYGLAEQVKILLIQGHLTVTDVNPTLLIRVEYGWDCKNFSLIVPAGFSATRYRKFDGESFAIHERNNTFLLPPCFRLSPKFQNSPLTENENLTSLNVSPIQSNAEDPDESVVIFREIEDEPTSIDFMKFLFKKKNLAFIIPLVCCLFLLIILLIGLFYRFCFDKKHRGDWTLKPETKTENRKVDEEKETRVDLPTSASTDSATQTKDQAVRI